MTLCSCCVKGICWRKKGSQFRGEYHKCKLQASSIIHYDVLSHTIIHHNSLSLCRAIIESLARQGHEKQARKSRGIARTPNLRHPSSPLNWTRTYLNHYLLSREAFNKTRTRSLADRLQTAYHQQPDCKRSAEKLR